MQDAIKDKKNAMFKKNIAFFLFIDSCVYTKPAFFRCLRNTAVDKSAVTANGNDTVFGNRSVCVFAKLAVAEYELLPEKL